MQHHILLTGSSGFIGKAVLRRALSFADVTVHALTRPHTTDQLLSISRQAGRDTVSVLNLAWPNLQSIRSTTKEATDDGYAWPEFRDWVVALAQTAEQTSIRFFQAGSGIEPYATAVPPSVDDPYLTYGQQKDRLWRQIQSISPHSTYRLRIHFVFGPGEAATRLIPATIDALRRRVPIKTGSLARRRHWIGIDDLADALISATIHSGPRNWDMTGTHLISFSELYALIGKATGMPAQIVESQQEIADGRCLEIAAPNPAPFLDPVIGTPAYLLERIEDYAGLLSNSERPMPTSSN